jgi:hypothetical protein
VFRSTTSADCRFSKVAFDRIFFLHCMCLDWAFNSPNMYISMIVSTLYIYTFYVLIHIYSYISVYTQSYINTYIFEHVMSLKRPSDPSLSANYFWYYQHVQTHLRTFKHGFLWLYFFLSKYNIYIHISCTYIHILYSYIHTYIYKCRSVYIYIYIYVYIYTFKHGLLCLYFFLILRQVWNPINNIWSPP